MKKFLLGIFCLFFSFCVNAQRLQDTLRIDGSNGVKPLVVALAEGFQKAYPDIVVQIGEGMNTKTRIAELEADHIDIAMASHGLDIPRFTQLGLQVHWFAKMAVVIGVHAELKLKNLSSTNLCDIYQGKFSDWSALGLKAQKIKALARPSDEVDTEVLVEKLACFKGIDDFQHLTFHQKSGPLAKALIAEEGAIGMTSAVRVAQSQGQIKAVAIDGIKPNVKGVTSGKYPFTRNAYLITKNSSNPAIKRFLQFVNSKTGRKILKANAAVLVRA